MTTAIEIPGIEPSQVDGAAAAEGMADAPEAISGTPEVEGSTPDTSESGSGKSK